MEEKTVLVTGIGGNVGQGVLRNIRDINWPIHIIGTNVEAFSAGNHLCDKTFMVPYAYDNDYIDFVKKIVEEEHVDLIIQTTDFEVYYLSLNANSINATIVACDASITNVYLDKYLSYKHHTSLNIPFVQSWLPSEFEGFEGDIIVKPRKGRGSRGITINPEDPKSYSDDYMIQPLHKGKEITTAIYIDKNKSLHGIFSMERQLQNGATNKCKTVNTFDNKLKEDIIFKMIDQEGIRGSLNLQYIVDNNQNIHLFEVNCRISGTNSIRHNLGFQDVKYILQEYLYQEKPSKVTKKEGVAIRLLYDVIYPDASTTSDLNNKSSNFKIY